ncbi:MAG TPA: MYXO-CTERM sorting domain-containing protein [Anaeromyxobacter sp.]
MDASSGRTDTLAGGGGSGSEDGASSSGKFLFPSDAFASGDSVYVLDAGNRGVRRVSLSGGAVTTVAGAGGGSYDSGGYADGAAASARFMPAGGLLVDGSDVLVADAGNACVRRVRDGMVSTIAGTGAFGARDGGVASARLALPTGIERLGAGEWLVVDGGASTLRRLSANDAPPPDEGPGDGGGARGCGCGSGGGTAMLALLALLGLGRALRRR